MTMGWVAIVTMESLHAMTNPIVHDMITAAQLCTRRLILSPTKYFICKSNNKSTIVNYKEKCEQEQNKEEKCICHQ